MGRVPYHLEKFWSYRTLYCHVAGASLRLRIVFGRVWFFNHTTNSNDYKVAVVAFGEDEVGARFHSDRYDELELVRRHRSWTRNVKPAKIHPHYHYTQDSFDMAIVKVVFALVRSRL